MVADISTFKILLKKVVSVKGDYFLCVADLKDFYIGSDLGERKQYMFVRDDQLPDEIVQRYKLEEFLHLKSTFGNGILVRCDKMLYGLPQAGLIAQQRLNKLLAAHGYLPTDNTPGLYAHETHPTYFTLVVDDFPDRSQERRRPRAPPQRPPNHVRGQSRPHCAKVRGHHR